MAARPRKPARKGWPPHLYARERSGAQHYYWQHPRTGKRYALGKDLHAAKVQAIEANIKLSGMAAAKRLVDLIADEGHETVSLFSVTFLESLKARKLAVNTLKTYATCVRRINEGVGPLVMRRVTTKDLYDRVIEPLTLAGKDRQAAQVHSCLAEMWKEAAAKGVVTENPVEMLKQPSASVKRERWTLETFMKTYEAALTMQDRWIARIMKLALVTAQPRECLVSWERSDVRDGFLWNERGKTGAKIKLPMSLTVPRVGWKLEDCIRECRDATLSRYILHHTVNRTNAPVGSKIALNAASKGIQRAREKAGLTWPEGRLPPTLHEIRSLSLRLYRDAFGRDFAQTLAGHKQGTTTDIYTDVRGAEWIEVRA